MVAAEDRKSSIICMLVQTWERHPVLIELLPPQHPKQIASSAAQDKKSSFLSGFLQRRLTLLPPHITLTLVRLHQQKTHRDELLSQSSATSFRATAEFYRLNNARSGGKKTLNFL